MTKCYCGNLPPHCVTMLEYNESPYVSTIRTKGNILIMRCPDFQVANNGTTKKMYMYMGSDFRSL